MGNPEADSSSYSQDQVDYNVQTQYNIHVSYDGNSDGPAYCDPNPSGEHDQSYQPIQAGNNDDPNPQYQQNDAASNQQQQQQFQPPPPQQQQFQPPPPQQQQFQPPPPQQQQFQPPQQHQQFGSAQNAPRPQFNQPYAAAPPHGPVAQFPPPSPQMNPAYANQGAYPPQQQPPPPYPPAVAAPQQYPPPQQQPQYAQQSAAQPYPPKSPLPQPYPPSPAYQQQPAAQPVQFPPPAGGEVQYAAVPPSPIKPGFSAAQGIPVQANMMGGVNTEGWRTGLFECMDDPMNAAITFFFPCLTFGQIAEIVDNGTTSCATGGLMYGLIGAFIGLPCIYSCTYRSKLRSKFGLMESPAPDWIVHCLFEPCALCQEYRELNRRGWDPTIGWMGNVQKQQQMQQQPQVAMTPPMNQTMMA